ncbi:MAG: hypothetical protein E7309_03645 [Butyrivibrio sp.]|nr:hypothetical protein [Butyrivibrio sp.]
MMINLKKFKKAPIQVKSSLLFFVGLAIQKVSTALSLMLFTRLMQSEQYGHFSIFNSWLSIWRIVITLCLSAGIYMQGLVKFEDDRKRFESSMQGLSFFLCMSWLIIYIFFRKYINLFFGFSTFQMIMAFGIIWSGSTLDFWSASERVEYRCKRILVLSVIVAIVKPLICYLGIMHFSDKVTGWIFGIAITELVFFSGFFISAMKNGRVFFDKTYWTYAISFSIPLIPHYLSQTVLNSADRIMIGKMVGDSEAGIYNLAYSIAMMLTMLSKAIVSMLNPWIYKKIKVKKVNEIENVGYLSLCLVAIVNLFLIALAPEIVFIIAPADYFDAIWIIPPIAISSYFMFSYDLFSEFAFYYNKTVKIMFASIIGAVLNIILNMLCIRHWGYFAASYTTLICFMIYAFIHYLLMNKICKQYVQEDEVYDWRKLIAISVVFMATGFGYMYSYSNLTIRLGISLALIILTTLEWKKVMGFIKNTMNMQEK